MKKLIALIKISWYYRQSEKAIDKGLIALDRGDIASAEKLHKLHEEYEKKAKACDWREKV